MTTYGLTGYTGHVGQELLKFPNVVPLVGDVTNKAEIDLAVRNTKPDVIVHLASKSNVDFCEDKKNEKLVLETNVHGTFHLADVGEKYRCQVVLLSTVQVFDGLWGNYKESNKPRPKNFYGWSKMGAERLQTVFPNLKVVRTSYLFDYERMFRHIYPLREGESFEYPTFIERSFMYLPHFAEAFYNYLQRIEQMPSILHISGSRTSSWYKFMCDVATVYGLNSSLIQPRYKEVNLNVAPRPYKAGLNVNLSKKLEIPQYGYLEGLQEMREISTQ